MQEKIAELQKQVGQLQKNHLKAVWFAKLLICWHIWHFKM
jgi:hypothetical protein